MTTVAYPEMRRQTADPTPEQPYYVRHAIRAMLGSERAARHAALCEALRPSTTADDLLRDAETRRRLVSVVRDGRAYTADLDGICTRAVQVEAVRRVKARADRRSCRGIAEKARRGEAGRIARQMPEIRRRREQARKQAISDRLASGRAPKKLLRELAAAAAPGDDPYTPWASAGYGRSRAANTRGLIRSIIRSVGRIGDQAEADLAHFAADESFSGKRGRHHLLQGSELARIEMRRDGSAALVTMRDYRSFGSRGSDGYESRGGSGYRCYLVVRDATTGEAHVLRVEPKYGNCDTQFFGDVAELDHPQWRGASAALLRRMRRATPAERRIHAAIAWTFGLRAGEYEPAVEA